MTASHPLPPDRTRFLLEVGKVGGDHAATALAALLKTPVTVRTLRALALPVSDIATLARLPGEIFVGTHFTLWGERMGHVLILMSREHACRMVDLMTRKPRGFTRVLDEYSQSVVREVGNILTGSYLTAIQPHVAAALVHSIPYLAIDQWDAILDTLLPALADAGMTVVLIETELDARAIDVRCELIVVAGSWLHRL